MTEDEAADKAWQIYRIRTGIDIWASVEIEVMLKAAFVAGRRSKFLTENENV